MEEIVFKSGPFGNYPWGSSGYVLNALCELGEPDRRTSVNVTGLGLFN